ncbi:secretoglobin family 2B member 24-like [Mastomys coucha]|uniref:secretoglobin family 2B member 24-like n=1 Tax=Mastomys coucha TaxID=35658 RepID=UPI001261B3D7|nr:secretoglobin family 2B member 24-like [Mastomys coucha]
MKGTLLLLALLVTGELGFQTTEACLSFFYSYATVLSGNEPLMTFQLSRYNANAQELEAFGKLQECYSKGGLKTILLNPKILESMLVTPECLKYYSKEVIEKIKKLLSSL